MSGKAAQWGVYAVHSWGRELLGRVRAHSEESAWNRIRAEGQKFAAATLIVRL